MDLDEKNCQESINSATARRSSWMRNGMYKHTDVSNRVNSINNNNNNSGWIPYQTKFNGGNVNESPSGKNYFECGLPIVDSFVSLFTLVIKMI